MTRLRKKSFILKPGSTYQTANGFTLLEVLLALAIALVFLTSLYASFITMMKTSDRNSARLEGLRTIRMAIMTMSDEIKAMSGIQSRYRTREQ